MPSASSRTRLLIAATALVVVAIAGAVVTAVNMAKGQKRAPLPAAKMAVFVPPEEPAAADGPPPTPAPAPAPVAPVARAVPPAPAPPIETPRKAAAIATKASPPKRKPDPAQGSAPSPSPISSFGKVRVVTLSEGQATWATVIVDGAARGDTPIELDLLPGSHRIKVERAGYATVERVVRVDPGSKEVLRLELK